MKFLIEKRQEKRNSTLFYGDYSFYMEPTDEYGFTSIMMNDLYLDIDDEGRITDVCGYCPLIKYEDTNECPKNYTANNLVAVLDKPPIPGVSIVLKPDYSWPIYINKKKGWVCIGNPEIEGKKLIEFVPNCVATMEGQELVAVWLHPEKLPPLD